MPVAPLLLNALRRELKAGGIAYTVLAQRLGVSHATVKRWLSQGNLTLVQLDSLLAAGGIEWARVASPAATEQDLLEAMSPQQEARIVADPELLLVALAAMNHLTVADMMALYQLSEARCLRCLLALDKMGFLELLPHNRIRMRVSRNFRWIADGPIQRWFRTQAADFLGGRFDGEREALALTIGMLTPGSAAQVARLARQLGEELTRLHHQPATAPPAERHLLTLLVAARSWEPPALRALRRAAPGGTAAVRTTGRPRGGQNR